jgi:hypothetical protein
LLKRVEYHLARYHAPISDRNRTPSMMAMSLLF